MFKKYSKIFVSPFLAKFYYKNQLWDLPTRFFCCQPQPIEKVDEHGSKLSLWYVFFLPLSTLKSPIIIPKARNVPKKTHFWLSKHNTQRISIHLALFNL